MGVKIFLDKNNKMKTLSKLDQINLILSIYVIIELYVSTLISYSHSTKLWIYRIDFIICLLFLYDFFRDLYHSESKINHIKTHYIDFISSIPTFSIFRIGRIFRIIRILRLVRSGKIIYGFIDKYNAKSAFENIVILNFIVLGFSTFSVYQLEKGINPDISTLGESLWWCINTIMTVGFVQDIILISIEGKVFSIILIISGLLLFGTFISFITDYFVKDQDLKDSVNDINTKISELEKKIDQLIKEKNN